MKNRFLYALIGMVVGVGVFSYGMYSFGTAGTENQELVTNLEDLKSTKRGNMLTADMWNTLLDLLKANLPREEKVEEELVIGSYFNPLHQDTDHLDVNASTNQFFAYLEDGKKGARKKEDIQGDWKFCSLGRMKIQNVAQDNDHFECFVYPQKENGRIKWYVEAKAAGKGHAGGICAANCFK